MAQLSSLKLTATATEATASTLIGYSPVHTVQLIINDSETGDLYINFGDPCSVLDNSTLVLKPGESRQNMRISCSILHYQASTGNVNFRFEGLPY